MPVTIDCNDIGLMNSIISVLIGIAATWVFAWLYYKKAGQELKEESARLRKATNLILYCHTNPDAKVGAILDAEGNITGLTVNMQANISGSSSLKAELKNKNRT